MKVTRILHINHAPITAVMASGFCWLGLYAVYANFAQQGFELSQRAGILSSAGGTMLIGLHAVGLLLLLACGVAAIAVLIKSGSHDDGRDHPIKVERPL